MEPQHLIGIDGLRQRPIEQALLKTYHDLIEELLRLAGHGLVFAPEPAVFIASHCDRLVTKLLGCLRQTYGVSHPQLATLKVEVLSSQLAALSEVVLTDIEAALKEDPATVDPLEVYFCYPGFQAVLAYRVAHVFLQAGLPLLPRMIAARAHERTGIDIHPGAEIGPNFFIDHGSGVVIGATSIIGHHVTLYQGVTLGAKRFYRDERGIVVKGQPRHPILGDHVTVYSGASILGRITIGNGSIIGGNVWLTESVPAGSRISQSRYQAEFFKDGDGI